MTDTATAPAPADTAASATPAPAAAGAPSPAPNPTPAPSPSGAGTSTTAPEPTPAPVPNAEKGDYKIPEAYKDKPWAAKIKSEDDLWKQLDNTQSLIGKKVVVPDLNKASDAEREEYYASTRPASKEEYKFNDNTDPDVKAHMSESLFKHGVTAKQANDIIADYQAAETAKVAQLYDPENFSAEVKKHFGDEVDPKGINAMLKSNLTPELFAQVNALPNPALAILYKATSDLKAKLIKDYGITESAAHIDAGGGAHQPADVDKVRENLRGQIHALKSKPHTAADKQKLIDQLNQTYAGVKA